MISKEEIEEIIGDLEVEHRNSKKTYRYIMKYITQLEARIKELEGIEAEHKKINGELREEISILKGENHE